MKKKILIVIIGIISLIILFTIPSNFTTDMSNTENVEYAGIPPVKIPAIPPGK